MALWHKVWWGEVNWCFTPFFNIIWLYKAVSFQRWRNNLFLGVNQQPSVSKVYTYIRLIQRGRLVKASRFETTSTFPRWCGFKCMKGSCQLLTEGCWFTHRNNLFRQLLNLTALYNQIMLKNGVKHQFTNTLYNRETQMSGGKANLVCIYQTNLTLKYPHYLFLAQVYNLQRCSSQQEQGISWNGNLPPVYLL